MNKIAYCGFCHDLGADDWPKRDFMSYIMCWNDMGTTTVWPKVCLGGESAETPFLPIITICNIVPFASKVKL